jgi:COMPASS component SWD3
MLRVLFTVFLIFILLACQPAPVTESVSPTETIRPSKTPLPTPTVAQTPTLFLTPTISPELLKEETGPICENSFSALFEASPLRSPFAVMKKNTYADTPTWELSHQLPHMGSLSSTEVQTVFCISETRTQAGTYTDGSPAYQLFWDVRAISWPDGKFIGRNSFVGPSPPKTKISSSGADEGTVPDKEFGAWVFDRVDHPEFIYFNDAISTIAVSPTGKTAAFGTAIANQIVDKDYQARIFLFNPLDLQIITTYAGHQGMVTSLAFSPDGKTLASSGFDLFVKFWDVATGRLMGQVSTADTPNALIFSPDGTKLGVASNLEVVLIDTLSMRVGQSVQEAGGDSLAFSRDGNHIYVNSSESIKIIDANANLVILTFPDPFALVPTTSMSADGSIVSVTYETPEAVEGFTLSPEGTEIITYTIYEVLDNNAGAENVRLATWDATTGKYLSEIKFSGDLIRTIKFSPDGTLLATGNRDEVWVWDTMNWKVKEKLVGHVGNIADLAFTADGTKILSAGSDGTIRLWSLKR